VVPDRRPAFSTGAIAAAQARGFTLLELLIALSMFAVLSTLSFGGLNSVLRARDASVEASARLADLQIAMSVLQGDVGQSVARPVRDELGDALAAMQGMAGMDPVLELTRNGWLHGGGKPGSELRRVAYRVSEQVLYRQTWPVLDRAHDSEVSEFKLMEGVQALQLRFLDQEGEWQPAWPPAGDDARGAELPRALELSLDLEGWGVLRRLFRVNG